jgi:hypothetical protein
MLSLVALLAALVTAAPAAAEPVPVRFLEGVTRGFPALRSADGELLADGDLVQVAHGDRVQSRMVFRFRDGSLYDETVVYSQRDVFRLLTYRIVQRGPSFPETLEAFVDRESRRYHVRYRMDEESAEEVLEGALTLPPDAYNGLLTTLLKNLPPGQATDVKIVAFTPTPRLVTLTLAPSADETIALGRRAIPATRFVIRPQLGLFASLLVADVPDARCWIVGGEAPVFLRFEGPLYFMGPVWRIDWN